MHLFLNVDCHILWCLTWWYYNVSRQGIQQCVYFNWLHLSYLIQTMGNFCYQKRKPSVTHFYNLHIRTELPTQASYFICLHINSNNSLYNLQSTTIYMHSGKVNEWTNSIFINFEEGGKHFSIKLYIPLFLPLSCGDQLKYTSMCKGRNSPKR